MGLPLFQAPVESDISSKPALKNPADPATARSPIRRTDRRRVHEIRAHRLQLLHVLQGNDIGASDTASNTERDRVPSAPRSRPAEVARPSVRVRRNDIWNDPAFDHESIREWDTRLASQPGPAERISPPYPSISSLPDPHSSLFAEDGLLRVQGNAYYDMARAGSHRYDDHSRSVSRERSAPRRSREPSQASGRPPFPPFSSFGRRSSFDSTTPVHLRSENGDRSPDSSALRRILGVSVPAFTPRSHRGYRRYSRHLSGISDRGRGSGRHLDGSGDRDRDRSYDRDLGGLGDRERSPEDDSAWDTLQSSITPDPHAPSVGSSFASTTVSAAASHTTGNSSNTSITNPEDGIEPPCDPVDQDANSDNEDDTEAELRTEILYRQATPHSGRRPFIDGVTDAHNSADEDSTDNLEWLSQMQSIVQGLAARQDIPDQWWAAVGLTRSMTSE
ncbi:hypothetical protein PFICI_13396 [Pestalotiopsis fici W106-1]|uniref:Uncharacterized protein n=1 Tax=Pestalotiopsis fici (strain W106-1 / CGMCC3.15140) TaxID=1229662 RepID=W3WP54_PESFW|nr:uncharacterized protein PFICI_13396 [Pestalotiopsis fici W106-1]ETS74912.1 hypothetical protein PFICI_13396 [Pestalotiopsis fici W106-1]